MAILNSELTPSNEPSLGFHRSVTKPYKFIGFGAMEVTKAYKFIGFGAMEVTKPCKFTGFPSISESVLLSVAVHVRRVWSREDL